MNVRDGILLVIMRLALLPMVIEPTSLLTPMAQALLSVQALKACAGVRRMRMHARAITKRMSPLGDEPGL